MKAKPPAKLENVNDEPNVAQSPLPRSGSVQQVAGANRRWRLPFRCRGSRRRSAVAQLSTLADFARMTDEALIAEAMKLAKSFGADATAGVSLEMLPKVRAVDAVVVYFESDEHDGKIEVFLEKESGKFITATLVPRKPKKST